MNRKEEDMVRPRTNARRTPGACGGKPRGDGSGLGRGNRNTVRQPAPVKRKSK